MDNELKVKLATLATIQKEMARHSLIDYAKLIYPNLKFNWFVEYYLSVLQKFIEDIDAGKNPRLIVAIPPRHGKSTLGTILASTWALGNHPEWKAMVACYGRDLAGDYVDPTRFIMKSEEYPFTTKIKGKDTAAGWTTDARGGYLACGLGGSFTGKGANLLIIDDLYKNYEEAQSKVIRDRAWNFFQSTFSTRENPEKSGILILNTRWHEDDIIGRQLRHQKNNPDADQYMVLQFPAIAMVPEYKMKGKEKVLLRSPGEALMPQVWPANRLLKKKSTLPVETWNATYQQDPRPLEGRIIQSKWFKGFDLDDVPNDLPIFSYTDSSYTVGRDSSVTIYGFVWQGNGYIIHVDIVDKMEFPDYCKHFVQIAKSKRNQIVYGWNTSYPFCDYRSLHLIEPKATGLPLVDMMKRFNVAPDKTKEISQSKVLRVKAITPTLISGKIHILNDAPWRGQFIQNCIDFEPGGKDLDEADALAGWIRNYLNMSSEELDGDIIENELMPDDLYMGSTSNQSYY